MGATDFDLIIGSYKAKVLETEGQRGYTRRTIRREIQQQLVSQSQQGSVLKSRPDGVGLYQTSWAGGATWWKPLIGAFNADTYFQSNHMDLWSEPGKVVPTNVHTDEAETSLHNNCVVATDGSSWYAIGDGNSTDAAEREVYKWTPGSDAWVRETGYSSGIQDDSDPLSMAYDADDGYFYVLAATAAGAREVGRFNPASPAHDLSWYTHADATTYGSGIVVNEFGLFYTGGNEVFKIDKSDQSEAIAFAPNFEEILGDTPDTNVAAKATPLFVNTTQGMYLVRNTISLGQPQAWIYRIDRDISGAYLGHPITTLPLGSVALSAQFHMGQLLVSTSPDYASVVDGEEDFEVVIYYVGEGGKGALGSVLGNRDEIDESPYRFLGTDGTKVYLAGSKRLWVYDAIRGGLHTAFEWTTAVTDGGYVAMLRAQDSAGDERMIFLGKDRMSRVKTSVNADPDTVTNFGEDETHYTLESNYFDAGLPMESKELIRVEIDHDPLDGSGNQEWTVQVSADDAAFTDVVTNSVADSSYKRQATSGLTGRRFRYKLIYQTKNTLKKALRGLLLTFASGEMVTEWDVYLDGGELYNIDNEQQDERDFRDDMVALGDTQTAVTLIDNMKDIDQETPDDDAGESVVVVAVEIIKEEAGESVVHVVLREA